MGFNSFISCCQFGSFQCDHNSREWERCSISKTMQAQAEAPANDDNEDQNSPVALATRNDSGIVRVPTPNPVSQQNLGYCVLLKKLNIFVPSQIFNQCYI